MIILILGGRGNLGSQLTKVFSADYQTISWDKEDFDVLDFNLLAEKIRELKPSVIINTVAFNAVDRCEDPGDYELAVQLNVNLPAVLADLSLEQRAFLIHYSSDYVFNGTDSKFSFTEDETPNPINKYGETKAQGEREIFNRAASGLQYYLIRTSKLFGPPGISPLAKPSFFDIMLKLSESGKELTVVNEELSCFTYTLDLAKATRRLWELEVNSGIYHLINENPCTWYEGATELFNLKKIKVNIRALRSENLLRPARRSKFSVLQNTKVKKLRSWREALKEYLNN